MNKIKTDSGIELENPEDGFIIRGCIFVARVDDNGEPNGGLFGNSKMATILEDINIKPNCYSVEEFIRGLYIDPDNLIEIANKLKRENNLLAFHHDV